MIDILEKIKYNQRFIEINFEGSPFQSKEKDNFEWILENLETKDPDIKIKIDGYIKYIGDVFIELNYNQNIYKIYRNPIIFELFYENKIVFKVYEPNQLERVLIQLQKYYLLLANQNYIDKKAIIELKKSNQLNNNKIILVPYILKIFRQFYNDYELEVKKNNEEDIYFNIDKETLEPYFLYIEKEEIKKKIGFEKMKNFNLKCLNDKITFILNHERKKFISELDNYINIDIQTESMIIIGNDGVGKSLTLQLYTLLEFKEYKKLYFNLKLLDKCNNRDYILIELMRGFISRDKNKRNNDFKQYIEIVKAFQDKIIPGTKQFFVILNKIINYLEEKASGKYAIILDQFNFENISLDDFHDFRKNIPNNEYYKIIICCSLSDDKNKSNMFSHYKTYTTDKYISKIELKPFTKKTHHNYIIYEEHNKNNGNKGTNIYNFNLIINKNKQFEEEEKNRKNTINIIDKNFKTSKEYDKTGEIDKNKEKLKVEKKENNEKKYISINIKKDDTSFKLTDQQLNVWDLDFPIYPSDNEKTFSTEKLKIYYSNLISVEKIIDDKNVNKQFVECMSYFNFLPKYYYKFYLFKIIKNLEGEKNISNIIKYFYEQENKNIKYNITKFYSNLNIKPKSEFEKQKNNDINLYQNLLKLKRCISKTYENSIRFYKLYEYSLKFPFKYINILIENEKVMIFNESLENSSFKLRYSFPFIENVIENMIEGYNNNDKININELSGSAYGNALEIKIRENLNKFKEKIEIRNIWSLSAISESTKKKILSKINENKDSSKRYHDLEDITEIKDIKSSNFNYFYFKPQNQDNKYFDSIFLVKLDNQKFNIIALQITKNKQRKNVKDKKKYSDFLIDEIKKKFEKLYKIEIVEIYFLYILSDETLENNSLCKILNDSEINYAFYSIKNKCFYKERNKYEIKSLSDFMNIKSLIYPQMEIQNDNDIENDILEPYPTSIKLFEVALYNGYRENHQSYFENIRYRFFGHNFGIKIGDNLKKQIIETIRKNISYLNDFELMFLFCFNYTKLRDFRKLKDNNELIYLFKCDNKIYLLFQDKCFEINTNTNSLVNCIYPKFDLINAKERLQYNKKEIELSEIEDIYKNNIIYLFKIYYLGQDLIEK